MSKVDDWKRPDGSLFMNAYYYSFEPTRYEPVDRVLSAVAIAGKWSHHTDAWTDATPGCWSPAETIQQEAARCADAAADMAHKLAAYERVVEAALGWASHWQRETERVKQELANAEQAALLSDEGREALTSAKLYVSAWGEHTVSVIERGRCKRTCAALDRLLSRGKDGR